MTVDLLQQIFTAATLGVVLAKVAPILLAALGGAFTQQGNTLNIGLEGMMLLGAFGAVAVGSATGSPLVGVLAAVGSALLLALVFGVVVLYLQADEIVVGIGINLLAAGLTVFLLEVVYGSSGVTPAGVSSPLPRVPIGPLAEISVLGPALDRQTPLVWVAFLAVPVCALLIYRTRFGVHLRAVGEEESAAVAAGIDVRRVKLTSVLLSGLLCGLAGAQLAMATLGVFTQNMTSGRGFIAVAALTFGLARPVRTMVAATIFGAADAVADQLSIAGINSNLALMTPYVITIVALTLTGLRVHRALRARRRPAPVAAGPA